MNEDQLEEFYKAADRVMVVVGQANGKDLLASINSVVDAPVNWNSIIEFIEKL